MDQKKLALEALSKEEIIQKYRNLLVIAQKAKAAKDDAQEQVKKLQQDVEESKSEKEKVQAEKEKLDAANSDQEVQMESLRRQLCRAEADCSILESQLESLDAENKRLHLAANNAEMQLRLGTEIRQDALEGLDEELANVKNTAAEALAERDSLRARLQGQKATSGGSETQTFDSCQARVQFLRDTQIELRTDILSLQSTAKSMALELGEAFSKAQEAAEEAARLKSMDLLAEMNEAMKTRGEVAAQLAEKLSAVERERDACREENKALAEEKRVFAEEKKRLLEDIEKSQTLCSELKLGLEESKNEVERLVVSKEAADSEMKKLQAELDVSRQVAVELEEKLNLKSGEINDVNDEFAKLQSNFEDFKANNYENSKEIEKLEDKCRQLIEINREKDSLLDGIQLKIADSETENTSSTFENFGAELEQKKEEVDLLTAKLKLQEMKIQELGSNNNILSAKIQDLEKEKAEFEDELSKLKLIIQDGNSKLELEIGKLKFLEEQKSQLEIQIEEERGKSDDLQIKNNELHSNLAKLKEEAIKFNDLAAQNKEFQDQVANLKEKISELEKEECETGSISTVSKIDDAARLKDVEDSFEERYTKLKAVAVKMKQKCQEQASLLTKLAAEKTEMQSKMSNASKERDNLARNLQSMQAACDRSADEAESAREKLKATEKQLTRAGEELAKSRSQFVEATDKVVATETKLKQTKDELDAAKNELKRHSVLNLEVAAYEKSSAEQDRKMKDLTKELETLKAQLECQKKLAHEGKTSVSDWEEKYSSLKTAKEKLEEELAERKSHSQELESRLAEKVQKLAESEANFEAQRSRLERVELQLAHVSAEKIRLEEDTNRLKEQVSRQIRMLEEEVTAARITVKERDEEMAKIQTEFEGYKVRAQSMLLRSQQQQPPKEENNPERECELSLLKTTVERLQTALCDASSKEKALQVEVAAISGQYAESQSSTRRLIDQITDLTNKHEDLSLKLKRAEDNLKETTRQHKLSIDTLASSYKQQLIEAETRHKAQIASLLEEKKEHQEEAPPVSLLKREEGEGSENVDSLKGNASTNSREPIPLDRLLSSSSDYAEDAKSEASFDAASLMSSTIASEKRAKHLSALLGEAEADLARLTHQNAILKEEIRRQQRCAERLQHTEKNGEYLKNVVLKFVTLQGGDERARLVPVLNTILKLSQEELQQLQTVAAPSTPTSPTPGQGGWSSYLHLWSGTH
ncbi:GRIP and coiled-coil domain-containing protein 2-like [Neocloeon triangulifer]|uniref:GRIP and coiled-coil domain-containing protein 2-like n=1 Tax=Neocloeon triangulifer TaxID=2078957 RepID=UPI00286ED7B0|nr:GRIP and coiled-coil domain-containing protein 2-like [Neocloeon triangulifer]XP_059472692.1 GRIP and coiled-coil domain-containing protein 2-like [Neocloeon triangulifer]